MLCSPVPHSASILHGSDVTGHQLRGRVDAKSASCSGGDVLNAIDETPSGEQHEHSVPLVNMLRC